MNLSIAINEVFGKSLDSDRGLSLDDCSSKDRDYLRAAYFKDKDSGWSFDLLCDQKGEELIADILIAALEGGDIFDHLTQLATHLKMQARDADENINDAIADEQSLSRTLSEIDDRTSLDRKVVSSYLV